MSATRRKRAGKQADRSPSRLPAGHPTRGKKPAQWHTWLWAGAWILAVLFVAAGSLSYLGLEDEGIQAMDGWRVAQGQAPYRDFFEIIPPVSFYPTALLVKVLGPTVWSVRLPALFLGLLLLGATDALLRKLRVGLLFRSAALAFLGPWGVFCWPCPSHHWYVTVFQLLAMLCVLLGADAAWPRNMQWMGSAGALTGLGALSLQDQGAYFAAAFVPLILFAWPGQRRERVRALLVWAAGALAAAAVVLIPVLSRASVSDVWDQCVVFPLTRYHENQPWFALGVLWDDIAQAWRAGMHGLSPFYLACRLLLLSLPLLAAGAVVLGMIRDRERRFQWGLLAAGVFAGFLGAAHRLAETNISWVAPLFLVPALVGASEMRAARRGDRWTLVLPAILIAVSVLEGVVLLRLNFPGRLTPVVTPAGTLQACSYMASDAGRDTELIQAVAAHVPPGEALFVPGYLPYLSFLTQHPNPSRYNFFIGLHLEKQADEVIASLQAHPSAYLLVPRADSPFPRLDRFFRTNYHIVWTSEAYLIAAPGLKP